MMTIVLAMSSARTYSHSASMMRRMASIQLTGLKDKITAQVGNGKEDETREKVARHKQGRWERQNSHFDLMIFMDQLTVSNATYRSNVF